MEGGDHPPNLVAAVEEDAVHASIEEGLALPPVLQVDQDIEEGKQGKCKAGGDEDEGDAPEVLVDGHPPLLLAAATEQGTHGSCQERPTSPASQTISMSGENLIGEFFYKIERLVGSLAHLEDIASVVTQEHLEHAGQAAKETLGIKGRGRVDRLGGGVAVDVGGGEESLVDVSGDSPDATCVVPLRGPLVEASRPCIPGLKTEF